VSLRLRLAVLFALATALAITIAGMLFLHQLRDNLDDTIDSGLRDRLAGDVAELAIDGKLEPLGRRNELSLVQNLDGTTVAATPEATQLRLTPLQHEQAVGGEVVFTSEVAGDRTRILVSTAPLGSRRVLVAVGTATDIADDAIDRVQAALIVMGPIAVVAAGVAAWLLSGAALRPVDQMRREAATIGEHDPGRRLAVPTTGDEVAALATTMNELLDRLHVALERDRQFMADAGHELRTPLAILRAELELGARPGRSQAALHSAIVEAGQETDRLIRLAEDLLLLARTDNQQPIVALCSTRLPELLGIAVRRGRSRDREPPIEIDCPDGLQVALDSDRMLQAIGNLLDNAVLHSPPGTPVQLSAALDDAGTVVIDVIDSGPGLPPEFLPHAFERFRRAEHARSRDTGGTGLGLPIVQAIVEAHGGTVTIVNRAGNGARATIRLRAAELASRSERESDGPKLA
jgi:two-component system OmpR family sensor kinase